MFCKTPALLVGSLLWLGQVYADVTINMDIGLLRDQNGNIVNASSIALLVADTNNVGLAALTNLAPSSLLLEGGPLTLNLNETTVQAAILGKWNISATVGTDGYLSTSVAGLTLSGNLVAGKDLYVLWFPTLDTSATQPGLNTRYGVYRDPNVSPLDGGQTWDIPSDGNSVLIQAIDNQDAKGNTPVNNLWANYQTIPEPSSLFLAAAGLLGLLAVRRRR